MAKDLLIGLTPPALVFLMGIFTLVYGRKRENSGPQPLPGVPVPASEVARIVPNDELHLELRRQIKFLVADVKREERSKDRWRDGYRDHMAREHPHQPMPDLDA